MGVSGNGDRELAALAARLAAADTVLRNQLRARWRAALAPAVDAVKASIATARPVRYERGLRAAAAASARSEVLLPKTGVRVSVISDGAKMPPGESTLPHHMDVGAWRHPVFQTARNPRTWVAQASVRPGWFTLTNIAQQPAFARAAQQVLDDVGHWIEGG